MDVRLKYADIEVGGEVYHVCCNMNVLADVQEACGGDLDSALRSKSTVRAVTMFLTAMINDCLDTQGRPPMTVKEIGRLLAPSRLGEIRAVVMALVMDACKSDGESSKNAPTTRGE